MCLLTFLHGRRPGPVHRHVTSCVCCSSACSVGVFWIECIWKSLLLTLYLFATLTNSICIFNRNAGLAGMRNAMSQYDFFSKSRISIWMYSWNWRQEEGGLPAGRDTRLVGLSSLGTVREYHMDSTSGQSWGAGGVPLAHILCVWTALWQFRGGTFDCVHEYVFNRREKGKQFILKTWGEKRTWKWGFTLDIWQSCVCECVNVLGSSPFQSG